MQNAVDMAAGMALREVLASRDVRAIRDWMIDALAETSQDIFGHSLFDVVRLVAAACLFQAGLAAFAVFAAVSLTIVAANSWHTVEGRLQRKQDHKSRLVRDDDKHFQAFHAALKDAGLV